MDLTHGGLVGVEWNGFKWLRIVSMAVSCECGNETSSSLGAGKVLTVERHAARIGHMKHFGWNF
jgi:hypothetical protein